MKVEVVAARELTPAQWSLWAQFQESDRNLASPFYHPEFTQAVAAAHDDVQVALVEQDGELSAFFPFHRDSSGNGFPVGLFLNDYQGVIARSGVCGTALDLVRGCGLRTFDFNHVPESQSWFEPHQALRDLSPRIDLSAGYEAYESQLLERHRPQIRDIQRLMRKIERDLGPLRLESDSRDRALLDALFTWKREQFQRTGVPDNLSEPWVRSVVERLWLCEHPLLSGNLTGLYAGDTLLAASLKLRSGSLLHGWWRAYDPQWRQFSTGHMESLLFLRQAAEDGVRTYDMGKGDEDYKLRFMTGATALTSGTVASTLAACACGAWWRMRRTARRSSLRRPLKAAANYYFRLRKLLPSARS